VFSSPAVSSSSIEPSSQPRTWYVTPVHARAMRQPTGSLPTGTRSWTPLTSTYPSSRGAGQEGFDGVPRNSGPSTRTPPSARERGCTRSTLAPNGEPEFVKRWSYDRRSVSGPETYRQPGATRTPHCHASCAGYAVASARASTVNVPAAVAPVRAVPNTAAPIRVPRMVGSVGASAGASTVAAENASAVTLPFSADTAVVAV